MTPPKTIVPSHICCLIIVNIYIYKRKGLKITLTWASYLLYLLTADLQIVPYFLTCRASLSSSVMC
jgi:hypothetical protein